MGNFTLERLSFVLTILLICRSLALSAQGIETLPGTEKPLTLQGDLSLQVLEQVDQFLLRMIERSSVERQSRWARNYSSAEQYIHSVEPNRKRFLQNIGLLEQRLPFEQLELVATLSSPALVAETNQFRIYAVRWPVLGGVNAEGLLLEPRGDVKAQVVALADADIQPEVVAGLLGNLSIGSQFARRLAEAGCRVLIPTLIDRNTTWSGNPRVTMSNQTHREFIYRQAYFLGRHLIGYEVQKVLAAVDYFVEQNQKVKGPELPVGVVGHGEGGLLAFYSAAADPRIDAALVSGYFERREGVWQEPLYRNVWGLLHEFGDAEIASLITPRWLIVEAARGPEISGPPPPRKERMDIDAAPGRLTTPPLNSVQTEFHRAREHYRRLSVGNRIELVVSDKGSGPFGSEPALRKFLAALGLDLPAETHARLLTDHRVKFDASARLKRQYDQLIEHMQKLMRLSSFRRAEFWSRADPSSLEKWRESCRNYRQYLWEEIIGWLPAASEPPNARTRLLYETTKWRGYETVINVWPDVFSYGVLLVPKDVAPGQRRPVLVAQHGRAGRPQDVCNPHQDTRFYHSFGAKLADRGFIVYAPQNLYIGEEKYRMVQRKANPLKLTFFAPMVRQHEQVLKWLRSLPFVDGSRIGFYGLSYGGKSAMLIPAVLEGYAFSICSADFNEQVWKHVSIDDHYSFIFSKEHEHTEFDFAEKFNYAELAGLIAPRPFMVERGHHDGVAPDEWVAYEYAKVRRLYTKLGIPDRSEIEFFDGGHEIHGKGTFDFIYKHLKWPKQ